MARAFFLLLVLGNLVFFVWAQGYLGGQGQEAGREPARLKQQIQADRLRVTVKDDSSAQSAPVAAVEVADVVDRQCRRVGPLASADAEKLKKTLAEKGASVETLAAEESSYWVHIPPAGGKEATDKKAQELRQLGVTDFFVVNDESNNRGAISLGLYHQEAAAKDSLQQLSKKGVRSAKITTKVRKTDKLVLDIRGGAALLDRLPLSGLTVKSVDCPAE
jgi:hypothetical protein